MKYVYYPDLPPFPDLPLQQVDESYHQYMTVECSRNGEIIPNAICTRHEMGHQAEQWIQDNISKEYVNIGYNLHGSPGGTALPHTDRARDWNLMWFLDTGGPEVRTVFWQEQDQPIEREPKYYPATYDNLIEIENHIFPVNQWILINAKVIHSIENLQTIRKSIQLGFNDESAFVITHTNTL
jgi:hypothetical protein